MKPTLLQATLASWRAAEFAGDTFKAWQAAVLGKAADDGAEPFAEPDRHLPRIERTAIRGLVLLWRALRDRTLRVLGLADADKGAKTPAPTFAFDAQRGLRELAEMEQVFIIAAGSERGPLLQGAFQMWVRGLENAAAEFDAEAAIVATRGRMHATLDQRGMDRVRNTTVRAFRDDIAADLARGVYDGENPRDVARALRRRFEVHDYDWERLARSELALAQARGKEAQYQQMGIEHYDFVTAGAGVCVSCTGLAAGGPYRVGTGPLPMRDTHPGCRCSIVGVEE